MIHNITSLAKLSAMRECAGRAYSTILDRYDFALIYGVAPLAVKHQIQYYNNLIDKLDCRIAYLRGLV